MSQRGHVTTVTVSLVLDGYHRFEHLKVTLRSAMDVCAEAS
jgi:hypothetical protein